MDRIELNKRRYALEDKIADLEERIEQADLLNGTSSRELAELCVTRDGFRDKLNKLMNEKGTKCLSVELAEPHHLSSERLHRSKKKLSEDGAKSSVEAMQAMTTKAHMTRYDIPWAITPTDSELAVLRELMAKYELHTLGTFDQNVSKAHTLLRRGKLAKAESQYFSHIESLKSARERLKSEGKDRIVKLIHGSPQDTEHQEPPDPDTVLTLAMQVFEANISAAEEWHREARFKREKFGDKIPDEERYQEVKGRKRAIKVQFVIIALVLSILAVAVGAWLYFIFAWLIVIPIALWAFAMFLALLRYGFQDESILSSLDSELREFAYRDGWLKRP